MFCKVASITATSTVVAFMALGSIGEAYAGVQRERGSNASGGVTAGATAKRSGPQGGTRSAQRGFKTDGAGNVSGGSTSSLTTANGFRANRSATLQRNANGTAARQSSYSASGARGTATSQGSVSRNADGTIDASRDTNLTSATTGNSANISRTYQTGEGVTRTTTCMDANGASITCPTRR